MDEFRKQLLTTLADHNQALGQLMLLAVDPEAADFVNEKAKQKVMRDGGILRVRTEITKRISAITHFDEGTMELVYAAYEDIVTGQRTECPLD